MFKWNELEKNDIIYSIDQWDNYSKCIVVGFYKNQIELDIVEGEGHGGQFYFDFTKDSTKGFISEKEYIKLQKKNKKKSDIELFGQLENLNVQLSLPEESNLSPLQIIIYSQLVKSRIAFGENFNVFITYTNISLINSLLNCKVEENGKKRLERVRSILIELLEKGYVECNVHDKSKFSELLTISFPKIPSLNVV